MSRRLNITVDEDVFDFIEHYGKRNRSRFINRILQETRQRQLDEEIKQGLLQDRDDPEYRQEMALWDICAGDGLGAHDA